MTKPSRPSIESRSRRRFLRGAAALGISGGLLGLLRQVARGGEGDAPLRFFFMFTGNGHLQDHFTPSKKDETAFDFATAITPLEPHRDKLLLLHGIQGAGSHHQGTSEALTGRPCAGTEGGATGGPSLDQLLAERFRGTTPLTSLELGVDPGNRLIDQINFSASGLPLPAIGSPLGAFDRLFALANEDPAQAEVRRARKASVLDVMAKDLTTLQGRLDVSARALLDEHLTLVRAQEEELAAPYVPVQCDLPPAPAGGDLRKIFEGHAANVASAFRCNITRVITLRVGGYGGIESGRYDEVGIPASHHNAAHVGPGDDLARINRFHAEQFADLIARLEAIPEGSGTVLDNTVMVWGMELGVGDYTHGREDMPFVIAGGKNAGLALGRYKKLASFSYQDFLLSLAHVMGQKDVSSFGDGGKKPIEWLWG